jgi:hypothetical protein
MPASSSSPFIVAALNVVSFIAAWLLFTQWFWNAGEADLTFFFGALVIPAAVVFWWGFGWAHEFNEGKASATRAAIQGGTWGLFIAGLALVAFLAFGSNLRVGALSDWRLLVEASPAMLKTAACFVAAGVASALLLHAENLLLATVHGRVASNER